MVRCEIYTFSVLLAVLLCSPLSFGDEFSAYCASAMQEGTKCSDTRHLIECVQRYGSWYAIHLADCGDELCCDASLPGCRISCSLTPSTMAPTTTTRSTTTAATTTAAPKPTTTPVGECNRGDFKPVPNDCTHYMYCLNGVWTEGKCIVGVFSEEFHSCVMGSC